MSPPQLPDGAAVGVSDGEPVGDDDVGARVSGHVPHITGQKRVTSDALGPRQALLFRLCVVWERDPGDVRVCVRTCA